MMSRTGAAQYQSLDLRSRIESATPHRLIQLMMERVLAKIGLAKTQLENGDIAGKGGNLGDAIEIINGLQASLNYRADESIAGNFDALYDYMMRRLLEANLHNDAQAMDEVAGLMRELKEAWDAIADQVEAPEVAAS
jgi:flagellar protein FliS